ncbi:glycosyltransferase family 4 protein [Chelatococcus sp. GCM10030263]|uniref:glycosyltransferase family 4 protein n=1 Tax=Chelatococcus sp. GCM10030263 TaxID=3273387 RepID=UPI003620944B
MAPLYICGMLPSPTGLGWSARLTKALARDAGLQTFELDVAHAFAEGRKPKAMPNAAGPGTLIIHLNPHQFAYGLSFLPPEALTDKYVIGYCVWELERIPADWMASLALLDEIWVPSHFTRRAFQTAGVKVPLRVVPYILDAPQAVHSDRKHFGLDEDSFIVATVANLRSGFARKNPLGAISAFQQAFSRHEGVVLAIKVGVADMDTPGFAKLKRIAAQDPRIRLICRDLSDHEMWSFLASADVVLSLHRAEGFGLTLAQAMLVGRPVVATAWSGNLDFMPQHAACLVPSRLAPVEDPDRVYEGKGLTWATPDIAAAADLLRRLHADPNLRFLIGEAGRQSARRFMHHHRFRLVGELRGWGRRPTELQQLLQASFAS